MIQSAQLFGHYHILTYFSFKCKENKGINIYVNICCFKTARC